MSNGENFPSPAQFVGNYVANSVPVDNGGQSTYDGSIAVTLLARTLVQNVLPQGFQLAARTDGVTTHPIIHLIGHQRNPMLVIDGELFPALDLGYVEMILLVPYVVSATGANKWHTFVARMFLNDFAAIEIGNTVFAYRKEFAYLPETAPAGAASWSVFPPLTGDVLDSTVTPAGPWLSLCGNAAPLAVAPDIQMLFAMPLVGVDESGATPRIVCSYWEWDYTNAEISQATSQHAFLQAFCPGMSGAWIGAWNVPCVSIRGLRWRLSQYPPSCEF